MVGGNISKFSKREERAFNMIKTRDPNMMKKITCAQNNQNMEWAGF
jgi:hypothetical protein